jgi:hypothetical protein
MKDAQARTTIGFLSAQRFGSLNCARRAENLVRNPSMQGARIDDGVAS